MLDHIEELRPLDTRDVECLRELRAVLHKHGKSERFGVTLAHKHFDVAEDEVLVESTNEDSRQQSVRVMKRQEVDRADSIATQFAFVEDERVVVATMECIQSQSGHYTN